ncbi:MAG: hypothetical protein NXH81_00945 [Halieaceae bacterium]|jgi:hypothetical protein|uniref:hypothetical protein n=1 Tax=Haliea alexandrii TaxID=2448162 RepID=UPI000F0B8A46|nr:hypothetical protein [Haliea alexandrii]MCR9183941.1 hypothetical protein [Halieaceae bacterium]
MTEPCTPYFSAALPYALRRGCRAAPLLALLLLLLPALSQGQEPDASLQLCRTLQQQIERLDDRRQHGASASQMDRWKRQRRAIKDRFNALRCRHWGNQLR